MKISNMPTGHLRGPGAAYRAPAAAEESLDSYQGVKPHWLSRVPLLGRALPFLSLAACSSSSGSEVKIGTALVAAAGVAGLYHLLNRSVNNRMIANIPSTLQMIKYGFPRVSFPKKLKSAEKVIAHYMSKGFSEEASRQVAFAWFFHKGSYSKGIGDLNRLDVRQGDLYGISSSFPNLADYPFDDHLQNAMERVACSGYMGLMLNALDRGIRTAPELVHIFLALNLKGYHANIGSSADVLPSLRYVLDKFSSRSAEEYSVSEDDVKSLFDSVSVMHRGDKKIADGIAHLLFGGMALGAYEAGQYDRGLELGFAHIRSARRLFESSSALQNSSSLERKSISTVVSKYPDVLSGKALELWRASNTDQPHPKKSWSMSMLPQTTAMLQSYSVKPA